LTHPPSRGMPGMSTVRGTCCSVHGARSTQGRSTPAGGTCACAVGGTRTASSPASLAQAVSGPCVLQQVFWGLVYLSAYCGGPSRVSASLEVRPQVCVRWDLIQPGHTRLCVMRSAPSLRCTQQLKIARWQARGARRQATPHLLLA